jgi:hypothetical protein
MTIRNAQAQMRKVRKRVKMMGVQSSTALLAYLTGIVITPKDCIAPICIFNRFSDSVMFNGGTALPLGMPRRIVTKKLIAAASRAKSSFVILRPSARSPKFLFALIASKYSGATLPSGIIGAFVLGTPALSRAEAQVLRRYSLIDRSAMFANSRYGFPLIFPIAFARAKTFIKLRSGFSAVFTFRHAKNLPTKVDRQILDKMGMARCQRRAFQDSSRGCLYPVQSIAQI